MQFTDKVVLITGAARGIGFGAAKAFAAKGAKLVLIDLKQESVEEAARKLNLEPADYLAAGCNVGDSAQVKVCVKTAMDKWGHVDVAFSNAGIPGCDTPLVELTDAQFETL